MNDLPPLPRVVSAPSLIAVIDRLNELQKRQKANRLVPDYGTSMAFTAHGQYVLSQGGQTTTTGVHWD